MAKLRVTHIEMDGSDQAVMAAIASFAGSVAVPPSAAPPSSPPLAPSQPVGSLPEPEDAQEEEAANEPAASRKPQRRLAAPAPVASRKASVSQLVDGGETIPQRILSALRVRPMSSLELSEFLKLEPTQVYTPCSNLKNKGLIVSRVNESGDGTRRYHLAAQ